MNSLCCVKLGVTFFLYQLWSLGEEQTPVASVKAPHYVNINGFLMNGNKTQERYICFPIACCAGRRWWMFHMGILKVEWMMQLYCQPGIWLFPQRHWPAEGLRGAGRADAAVAELQGPVWGILASRWNGSRIFPIWTGARQRRGRRCN